MLYYFGWVRTNAIAGVYGIDDSLLAFSADDYVLRSVPSLFLPVGAAVLGSLAVMQAHPSVWAVVDRRGTRASTLTRVGIALECIGWAAIAWGALRLLDMPDDRPPYLTPLLLGSGALLVGYGSYTRRRAMAGGRAALPPSMLGLLIGLGIVAAFTATFRYADAEGRSQARRTILEMPHQPETVVLSKTRLQLDRTYVDEVALETAHEGDYAWEYRGLRFLTRNGDNLFLVPTGFGETNRLVMIVPAEGVRLEFNRGNPASSRQ